VTTVSTYHNRMLRLVVMAVPFDRWRATSVVDLQNAEAFVREIARRATLTHSRPLR
jgi:hypothetical protein